MLLLVLVVTTTEFIAIAYWVYFKYYILVGLDARVNITPVLSVLTRPTAHSM